MSTITGVVQAKSQDGKRIKVNDTWYSVYSASTLTGINAGDDISFSFVQKGQWNNISGKVTVNTKGNYTETENVKINNSKVGSISLDRDRTIARQNALTNARELFIATIPANEVVSDLEEVAEKIINIAYKFENYTTGDREKNKVLQAFKELTENDGQNSSN